MSTRFIVKLLGGVMVGVVGLIALSRNRSKRQGRESLLLPPMLEAEIDKLISWLEARFGKEWVDFGLDAVQQAVSLGGSELLLRLLKSVYQSEVMGRHKGWSGAEKLAYAADAIRRTANQPS